MRIVVLHMIKVVVIVLIAHLTVSVVAIRHRLWNIKVMLPDDIHVSLKVPLQVLLILLFPLLYDLIKLISNELELCLAHTGAKAVRRVHLKPVEVKLGLGLLGCPVWLKQRASGGLRLRET